MNDRMKFSEHEPQDIRCVLCRHYNTSMIKCENTDEMPAEVNYVCTDCIHSLAISAGEVLIK